MDGGGCALIFHQFKNVCTHQDGIPLSSVSLNKRREGEGGREGGEKERERERERQTDRQSETERDREEQEQEGGKR